MGTGSARQKWWSGSTQERQFEHVGWLSIEYPGVPRFFFDIHDGERFTPDDTGMEFPDAQAARDNAVVSLPDIARDVMPGGQKRTFVIAGRDESGTIIYRQPCRSWESG